MDISPVVHEPRRAANARRNKLPIGIGAPQRAGASTRGLILERRGTAADIHKDHAQLHLDGNAA